MSGTPYEFCAIPTVEALRQMLRSAGFEDLDVEQLPSLPWLKRLQALPTNRPQSGRTVVHAR